MRSEVSVAAVVALLALAGCLGAPPDGTGAASSAGNADGPGNGTAPDANATYAPGWPPLDEAAIRPGVGIHNRSTAAGEAWDCTSSFLFSSPDNRTLYLGTAAHCFSGDVFVPLGGPVEVGEELATGTLVYSSWRLVENVTTDRTRLTTDLALVALPDGVRDQVHPAVRWWGGPTGLATDVSPGDEVRPYYNSWLHHPEQTATNRRLGVVTEALEHRTRFHSGVPAIPGDSGSPVLAGNGSALGVLSRVDQTPLAGEGDQDAVATNLASELAFLREHGDLAVELETWPTLHELPAGPPGTAPGADSPP